MSDQRKKLPSGGTTRTRASQVLKSVHEGWAYHFNAQSRTWTKRWLVLDGSRLVVFSSERGGAQAVIVSLNLGEGTKIKDVALQPHVYGLNIELTTMKGVREARVDFFGFSTPNECDVWKAYILGFSYGVVPENLNLLPGQLKDVREAILDLGQAPPPLPQANPKRPTVREVLIKRPSLPFNSESSRLTVSAASSSSQNSTGGVVSPYSDIQDSALRNSSTNSANEEEVFDDVEDEDDEDDGEKNEADVLDQLEQRRKELAMKALGKEDAMEPLKHVRFGAEQNRPSAIPASPGPWQPARNQSQPVIASGQQSVRFASQRAPAQRSRAPLVFSSNNNELLPFYDDPEKNKETPPWFMSCTREMAEMILTAARIHGNMFLRPSFNVNPTETYVISMRRDLPGGLELRHYAVYRTADGFKLDVVDKHHPMSCLSDVMNFFARYVGPSAQFLNSDDVSRVLGVVISPGSVTSPKSQSQPPETISGPRGTEVEILNDAKEDKSAAQEVQDRNGIASARNDISVEELQRLQLDESISRPSSAGTENSSQIKTTPNPTRRVEILNRTVSTDEKPSTSVC